MKPTASVRARFVAVILGAVVVVGILGTTVAAGLLSLNSVGEPTLLADESQGDPALPGEGDPGLVGRLPGGSRGTPPPLTTEQQEAFDRVAGYVASLADILDEASTLASSGDWDQCEARLLGYVSAMSGLEAAVDEFVTTLPAPDSRGQVQGQVRGRVQGQVRGQVQGQFRERKDGGPGPGPRIYLGPILADLAGQGEALAAIWQALPEANRVSVREAVNAAVSASDNPRFWALLVRLVRGEGPRDPAQLRECLERALQRAVDNMTRARQELARLTQRIAKLTERIAAETDPDRRHNLEDLKHLAELELQVCQARIARDEFAIQTLQERLAGLPAKSGN
jgi:hypothetical protein